MGKDNGGSEGGQSSNGGGEGEKEGSNKPMGKDNGGGEGGQSSNGGGEGKRGGYENFVLYQLTELRKELLNENWKVQQQNFQLQQDIGKLRLDASERALAVVMMVNRASWKIMTALFFLFLSALSMFASIAFEGNLKEFLKTIVQPKKD